MSHYLPLGRNFRTRTTTRTFPPGEGLAAPSWRVATATLSRARREGLEAFDRSAAAEADVDTRLGEVMPVRADRSEDVADDIEPGPGTWSRWR